MITDFAAKRGLPEYRIKQFNTAYYQEFISSYDSLTTWPKALRDDLNREVCFSTLEPLQRNESADKKTVKVLFKRQSDGQFLETVLMKHRDGRNTVCVSCMIGCPMACTFCATGKMGFKGSLSSREIVDQVLYFARLLKNDGQKVTNIVFMGMGEPLINLLGVVAAIKIFTDPEKIGMSMRRITVSTSGVTPNLRELLKTGYKGRLALSLHAPNRQLREKIMPITAKYPLEELLTVLSDYARSTNKRVSYEYILIDGVNDSVQHARELVQLIGTYLTHVNLIPYNPVLGTGYGRSKPDAIRAFSRELDRLGLQHTIRVTMGDDIQAACGQLANKALSSTA